jgi:hypothetical protein
MANPYVKEEYFQEVLPAGTNLLFTGVAGWKSSINGITFNNQSANDVTLRLTRANPTYTASTVDMYTFSLAAGDVVCDNNSYVLFEDDTLELITTANDTNFFMTINSVKLV